MRAGGTISRLPIALAPVLLLLATALAGCGQKGPLFIPDTPAAAQRATLPQTIFGGGKASDAEAQQQRPEDGQPAAPDIDLDSEP
ncbi:MAG: lipoprotein [Ottowia sp.]|nr:lipoprotein [Ottowia sp.]